MAAVRHVAACEMANKNEISSTEIARLRAGGRESTASWLFDTLESFSVSLSIPIPSYYKHEQGREGQAQPGHQGRGSFRTATHQECHQVSSAASIGCQPTGVPDKLLHVSAAFLELYLTCSGV